MDNAAIISGYSVWMPYAEDCSQLIDNLKQGKRVARTPWFTSNEEAIKCGFKGNPSVATLKQVDDSALDLLLTINQQTGTTFVISTHSSELKARARRVVEIQDGVLIHDSDA